MNREKIGYFIMLTYHEDKIIMILNVYAGNYKENLKNSQLTYSDKTYKSYHRVFEDHLC